MNPRRLGADALGLFLDAASEKFVTDSAYRDKVLDEVGDIGLRLNMRRLARA